MKLWSIDGPQSNPGKLKGNDDVRLAEKQSSDTGLNLPQPGVRGNKLCGSLLLFERGAGKVLDLQKAE